MNNHTAVGKRFWKPDYDAQEQSARLFCPVDSGTLSWLAERANGRPLGVVAAEVLATIARAESGE